MAMSSLLDGAKSMSEKPKKRKWMQKAVPESRKGIFTEKAKSAGKSVAEEGMGVHVPLICGYTVTVALEVFDVPPAPVHVMP